MLTYDKSKFDKTGELIGATTITDDDEIILINSDGIVIRIDPHDIKPQSRSTMGVKIMRVEEESEIIALSKVEAIGEENSGDETIDETIDETVAEETEA
jgi:DNA gyrase subunit A